MPKKLKTLVIHKDEWLCGDEGYLRRPGDGKQCCLGFLARACGATKMEINGAGTPSSRPDIKWPEGLLGRPETDGWRSRQDSSLAAEMMRVNDDADLTDKERIRKLRPLFAEIGYKLVFK